MQEEVGDGLMFQVPGFRLQVPGFSCNSPFEGGRGISVSLRGYSRFNRFDLNRTR
jgi:hypothetical protein